MDMLLTELLLWGGLLFIFWAMHDALGKVETDIRARYGANAYLGNRSSRLRYASPEEMKEVIGTYRDASIYRYITIAKQRYVFDRIQLGDEQNQLEENEACIAPGLIYVRG